MNTPQFVNLVVTGAVKLTLRGEGVAVVDFNEPLPFAGEQELEVTTQANLRVAGQVIAYFAGRGAFVVDHPARVRVITDGNACVNMTSPTDFHVGGKGVIFAEGAQLRVDQDESVIAVDCPYVHVHNTAQLTAIGCGRVEAYDQSTLAAFGAESVLAVENATLNARDCREVFLDHGDEDHTPDVGKLVNCGEPVQVAYDPVAHTEELGYHSTFVPVAGGGTADEHAVGAEDGAGQNDVVEPPAVAERVTQGPPDVAPEQRRPA